MIDLDPDNLTAEDLACLGLRRANEWSFEAMQREIDPDADRRALMAFAASSAPHRRRERKPTLAAALKEAERAGRSVKGAALYPDHVEITFDEPAQDAPAVNGAPFNPWDQIYETDQKRPS
jgi:hypothetical protein